MKLLPNKLFIMVCFGFFLVELGVLICISQSHMPRGIRAPVLATERMEDADPNEAEELAA
jgi:hypothetical protein